MLDDYRLKLCDNQTLVAATPFVSDSIDLLAPQDVSEHTLMFFTVVRGGVDGDFLVELIRADDAALTTNVIVMLSVSTTGIQNAGQQITIPLWDPIRTVGTGGFPNLTVTPFDQYYGLRLTSEDGETVDVLGTLGAPAISPIHYPKSYEVI